MEYSTANAISRYFEALYNLNQKLIILCGTNEYNHTDIQQDYTDHVITTIPRLIPYQFKTGKNNEITLVKKDGLLRFSGDISFLTGYYENILLTHNVVLIKVKKIRNKLEHAIDNARIVSFLGSPSPDFSVIYKIDDKNIVLGSNELIALVKDLNTLFSEIQKCFNQFVIQNDKQNHPYTKRLTSHDFSDFNKIYECDMLHIFGKNMLPF